MNEDMANTEIELTMTCPIPIQDYPHVLLAHGGGGKLMHQLIERMFKAGLVAPQNDNAHDAAVVDGYRGRIAFTTDSYVVNPLFFPGGDIGLLAVNGTVNDLAMAGARPVYLSVGFILEEGLPMETLWKVVCSIRKAADQAGVHIVTGDTKVVDRGKGDGLFINTSGIGYVEYPVEINPSQVKTGDVILINGDIARHGMAIMAVRDGLTFESAIESDTAPLDGLVQLLLDEGVVVHCLRDLTRGGLASALNEIAQASNKGIRIEEDAVPVRGDVAAACEILGFDPLYVANEGRCVAFVAAEDKDRALTVMRQHEMGREACVIGEVVADHPSRVVMTSRIGAARIVDMISGEQLPRIC